MTGDALQYYAGQSVALLALALCVAAFANKQDDRLLLILIFGNVAFAVQFALFEAWVAAGISALIVLRIILARKMEGNWIAMLAMLLATILIAGVSWQGIQDVFPLAAGVFGTVAMFMLRGIPMRAVLALAAACWIVTNAMVGSIGALAAEAMMLATNLWTISRILKERRGEADRIASP
ncbi:YgjV family protein [Devosia pacifica]|nr:YgjV family protein [Devosia pacifica]